MRWNGDSELQKRGQGPGLWQDSQGGGFEGLVNVLWVDAQNVSLSSSVFAFTIPVPGP